LHLLVICGLTNFSETEVKLPPCYKVGVMNVTTVSGTEVSLDP